MIDEKERNSEWIERLAICGVSVLMYELNVLILFLIPLEIYYARKGARELLFAGALTFVAVAVIGIVRTVAAHGAPASPVALGAGFALPLAFIGALPIIHAKWRRVPGTLGKLLLTAAGVGVISIPLLLYVTKGDDLLKLLTNQLRTVSSVFGGGTAETSGLFSDPKTLAKSVQEVLLRSYLFIFFLLLAGTLWIGDGLGKRTLGIAPRRLSAFRVPEHLVWALIVSWATVLLGVFVKDGILGYLAWNAAMIMLFTYGMQGVGIAQSLLERRGVSRGIRAMLIVLLLLLLFWPGVNFVVIIGLPGLGVSEIWVNYRRIEER